MEEEREGNRLEIFSKQKKGGKEGRDRVWEEEEEEGEEEEGKRRGSTHAWFS